MGGLSMSLMLGGGFSGIVASFLDDGAGMMIDRLGGGRRSVILDQKCDVLYMVLLLMLM